MPWRTYTFRHKPDTAIREQDGPAAASLNWLIYIAYAASEPGDADPDSDAWWHRP